MSRFVQRARALGALPILCALHRCPVRGAFAAARVPEAGRATLDDLLHPDAPASVRASLVEVGEGVWAVVANGAALATPPPSPFAQLPLGAWASYSRRRLLQAKQRGRVSPGAAEKSAVVSPQVDGARLCSGGTGGEAGGARPGSAFVQRRAVGAPPPCGSGGEAQTKRARGAAIQRGAAPSGPPRLRGLAPASAAEPGSQGLFCPGAGNPRSQLTGGQGLSFPGARNPEEPQAENDRSTKKHRTGMTVFHEDGLTTNALQLPGSPREELAEALLELESGFGLGAEALEALQKGAADGSPGALLDAMPAINDNFGWVGDSLFLLNEFLTARTIRAEVAGVPVSRINNINCLKAASLARPPPKVSYRRDSHSQAAA